MTKIGLNLDHCIGISTDGCSVMVSTLKGAVQYIQKFTKHAIYCPCNNHALNLSISKSSTVQSIRNSVGIMQQVISFFKMSAKRNFVLKKYLKRSLVKLCETRWVERHDSVLQFKSSLTEIIKALTEVSNWEDTVSASTAKTLILSLCNCEFILSIYSLSSVLSVTYHASKILQGKNQDILSASNVVEDIVKVLEKNRFDCEIVFKNIYSECKSIMDQLDVEIKLPRLNISQKNRPNPNNINNCEDYYRITIFIFLYWTT